MPCCYSERPLHRQLKSLVSSGRGPGRRPVVASRDRHAWRRSSGGLLLVTGLVLACFLPLFFVSGHVSGRHNQQPGRANRSHCSIIGRPAALSHSLYPPLNKSLLRLLADEQPKKGILFCTFISNISRKSACRVSDRPETASSGRCFPAVPENGKTVVQGAWQGAGRASRKGDTGRKEWPRPGPGVRQRGPCECGISGWCRGWRGCFLRRNPSGGPKRSRPGRRRCWRWRAPHRHADGSALAGCRLS